MKSSRCLVLALLIVSPGTSTAQWIQSGLASDTTTCLATTDSALFAGTRGGLFRSSAQLSVVEYLIPRSNAFPHDPAVAPDGVAWYTDQANSYIGKINPATGVIVDYPTPTPSSGPHGIDVAPDGSVWYTAQNVGRIGKVNPSTGSITEFVLPAASNRPHTPLWHGGYIWYTAQSNFAYGRLNPVTGTANVFSAPAGSNPYGISAAPDGSLWIALFGTNKLGRVDTTSGAMQLFTLPNSATRPRRLAVASNGLVYYTDYSRGYLGRLDPATSQVREWLVPDIPPGAYGIAIGTDGRVWFNAQGTSAMFAFDPATEQMEPVPIPTAGAIVRNMVCDKQRGVLWLALSGTQRLGRVDLARRNWVAAGFADTAVNAFAATPIGTGGTRLFAGTDAGMFRSTDHGDNWSPAGNGLPGLPVTSLTSDGTRLFAGLPGGGVYLSTDNGGQWSPSSTGLPDLSVVSLGLVNAVLLCGTQNGVFRSVNLGATWESANAGLPDPAQCRATAFTGSGTSTFAAFSHVTGTGGGVYMSTNNGLSWTSAASGLDDNVVALIENGGTLYAGTRSTGVYVSTSSGGVWGPYNFGLSGPALEVDALAMYRGALLAGTADGVWMRSPSIVTAVHPRQQTPTQIVLGQNYPNPFSASTSFRFTLGTHGHTCLRVVDLLGREVATLVNESLSPGQYVTTWNAHGVSTGVYFYRLTAGESFRSGRLVVLR